MPGDSTTVINDGRVRAWKDTLTPEELAMVERLEDMPPSMAIAYVYVDVQRRFRGRRPLWQQVSAGASGGFIAVAALFAHWMGWDKALK